MGTIEEATKLFNKTLLDFPFCQKMTIDYKEPFLFAFSTTIVRKSTLEAQGAFESDFLNEYTRKAIVIVTSDFDTNGCRVFCQKWDNVNKVPSKSLHFEKEHIGAFTKLCVGVPGSFKSLPNPIKESLRTAEHTLIAYELFLKGINKKIELIDYSHGYEGEKEYEGYKKKYHPKR